MSTEQITREEAIDIVCIEMDYVDAHGGLEVSMPFDAGVEWQKMQPCPRCSELEAILKDLGPWASAALDDDSVCKELKDIFQRVVDKAGGAV